MLLSLLLHVFPILLSPFSLQLIVMTPKSLLRHPDAKSRFSDFEEGTHFLRLIPDETAREGEGEGVKRIIFCSGKVYYELAKQRELASVQDSFAISRVEQASTDR